VTRRQLSGRKKQKKILGERSSKVRKKSKFASRVRRVIRYPSRIERGENVGKKKVKSFGKRFACQ